MSPDGRYDLLVCRFPGNNQEHPRSAGYIIGLMKRLIECDSVGRIQPYTVSDTPITMCRNRAVKYALDNKFDYILMIDSDMEPDVMIGSDPNALPFFPTAWDFMMTRRKKERSFENANPPYVGDYTELPAYPRPATIAAPYCGPPPEESVYVFEWKSRASGNPVQDFKLGMISRESAAIRAGVQEVAALPTGLILYDARVFADLPKPWFDYEWSDDSCSQKATTEDVYQTRNASMLGMPQFVLWDCWAGHIKLKTVSKPILLTPEIVSQSLRKAMAQTPAGYRLKFLTEEDEASLDASPEVD